MTNDETSKRIYLPLNREQGYPAGGNLYDECLRCGGVIPSLPVDSMGCSCHNIFIDVDYGRLVIRDHDSAPIREGVRTGANRWLPVARASNGQLQSECPRRRPGPASVGRL